MTSYIPGTTETDPKKQNRAIQQLGVSTQKAQSDISSLQTTVAGLSPLATATVGQIPGTTGDTQPAAGFIGELISSGEVSSTLSTSGVAITLTSITLTPGIWDIEAMAAYGGPGATTTSDVVMAISTTAATVSTGVLGSQSHWRFSNAPADLSISPAITRRRVAISTSTTYYLNGQATYSGSAPSFACDLQARRVS